MAMIKRIGMKSSWRPASGLFLLLILALMAVGCGPRTQYVLLPDPDGQIGKLAVTSQGGETVLERSGEATGLDRPEDVPSQPEVLTEKKIRQTYGPALDAAPDRPVVFLLYFKSGTAELTAESLALLPEIKATIQDRKSNDISVIGHTDRVGAADVNAKLAGERAQEVAKWLISEGVAADIIEITSHGEGNPVVPTEDEVAEPKNRRVEVTVR
jgi:outer membrane protein OmpA-like peptidoglycan-associated protein